MADSSHTEKRKITFSSIMLGLGMICLIIMVTGQTYEVILRYIFGHSTGIMDEVVSQCLVGIIVTGIGYTMKTDSHVRITMLTDHLPENKRRWFKLVGSIISLFACILASYYLFYEAADSYASQVRSLSPLNTLLYLPQGALGIGFTVLTWELLKEIVTLIRKITGADRRKG